MLDDFSVSSIARERGFLQNGEQNFQPFHLCQSQESKGITKETGDKYPDLQKVFEEARQASQSYTGRYTGLLQHSRSLLDASVRQNIRQR